MLELIGSLLTTVLLLLLLCRQPPAKAHCAVITNPRTVPRHEKHNRMMLHKLRHTEESRHHNR